MPYEFPDYDNCCVNIINSIYKYFGLTTYHKTLPLLDIELKKDYENIVLLILDGLGQELLVQNLPKDSFLRQNFVQELSSIYPSSTVPATVSFKTGLTPLEHGWWSHFMYFKEIGQTINVYTNNDAFSRKKVGVDDVAHLCMPYQSYLERISENSSDVRAYSFIPPEARENFGITQISYDTFDEMSEYVQTLTELEGKKVIYCYHNYPDQLMHKFGWHSDESIKLINDLDCQVADLCRNAHNTLFIITSDHGQTMLNESRDITAYPDLVDTLLMLPGGCTRCANLYVKPERKKEFEKLAKRYFGDKFLLLSKQQILKMNLFGSGTPHPKLDDLLGDYCLIGISDANITYSSFYGKPRPQPTGIHGGLTKSEMRTPLILYGTKFKGAL